MTATGYNLEHVGWFAGDQSQEQGAGLDELLETTHTCLGVWKASSIAFAGWAAQADSCGSRPDTGVQRYGCEHRAHTRPSNLHPRTQPLELPPNQPDVQRGLTSPALNAGDQLDDFGGGQEGGASYL
jgi:hypothetical protein